MIPGQWHYVHYDSMWQIMIPHKLNQHNRLYVQYFVQTIMALKMTSNRFGLMQRKNYKIMITCSFKTIFKIGYNAVPIQSNLMNIKIRYSIIMTQYKNNSHVFLITQIYPNSVTNSSGEQLGGITVKVQCFRHMSCIHQEQLHHSLTMGRQSPKCLNFYSNLMRLPDWEVFSLSVAVIALSFI